MTTIVHKRGIGIPAADDLAVGEIAIDTSTGNAYTKNDSGEVVPVVADPEWAIVGKEDEEQVGMHYWAQSVYLGYTNSSNPWYTDEAVGIGFNATAGYGGVGIGWDAGGGMLGVAVGYKSLSGDNGTAIGCEAKATKTLSIALGTGAEATKQCEFAISPRIKEVNFSGTTVQADDFIDADGNSIVGGGGDSIWTEVRESDKGGDYASSPYRWVTLTDQATGDDEYGFILQYSTEKEDPEKPDPDFPNGPWDRAKLRLREILANKGKFHTANVDILVAGDVEVLEQQVLGGIQILGANQDRPDQLPGEFSPDGKSIQYALTVFHETLGRTVTIDKEGFISARGFTDQYGKPITGTNIPFDEDEGVISTQSIRCSRDPATGEWGPDVWAEKGGTSLKGGHGENGIAFGRIDTLCFKPVLIDQGYEQWAYDTDDESITPPHDPGVWAMWEHHNPPNLDFNIRIWGGKTAKDDAGAIKRPGMGAPQGRCEFYDGHFSEVRSGAYLDKDGGAMMSINDVIEGFSAVQQAVSDEVTVEGLRDAIANAVGGFIERLEARQAEVQREVKKAADDYHDLMESHCARTQEEKA